MGAKLLLVIVLVAAVVVVILPLRQPRSSWTKVHIRNFVFVLVAGLAILLAWPEGAWTIIAIILFLLLLLLVVLSNMDNLPDPIWDLLWGRLSDPNDPTSGPRFGPIVWVQAGLVAFFCLLMFIAGLTSSSAEEPKPAAQVPPTSSSVAPTTTSQSPSTTTTPSAPASSSAPSSSVPSTTLSRPATITGCDAPTLNRRASAQLISFGARGIEVCENGQWKPWSGGELNGVFLTAWLERGEYGYGAFTVEPGSTEYLIRTKEFRRS